MNKLLFSIFLFCIVAASLISCSNDDEALFPNVEASEMQFIKLDDIPSWLDLGKDNKKGDAYMEALMRIVDFDGQRVSLRYKSAEESKVSQNLYDNIVGLYSDYLSLNRVLCRDDQDGGRLRFFSVEDVKAVFRVSYPKILGEIY